VAAALSLLDKRGPKRPPSAATASSSCNRDFKADDDSNKKDAGRVGLVTAVDASGSPVTSVIPAVGDGERYVYHWMVLVAAKLEGCFAYGACRPACSFVATTTSPLCHGCTLRQFSIVVLTKTHDDDDDDDDGIVDALPQLTMAPLQCPFADLLIACDRQH